MPACAQVAFELSQIPTPARATAMFAHLPSPTVRLSYFIGETCRCYAAGADWLRAAWRERDLVPAMEQSVARLQQALRVLLDSVLVGLDLSVDQHRLLSTLLDFPFWESLDRSGMARARIPDHIEQLALTALASPAPLDAKKHQVCVAIASNNDYHNAEYYCIDVNPPLPTH